ncbi:MAG: hypothetical protein V2B19_10395 [Pseudomonadota bacterium]
MSETKKKQIGLVEMHHRYVLLTFLACIGLLFSLNAHALSLNVQGVNGIPIAGGYHWTIEEDRTYHVPLDGNNNPVPDPNTLSVSFHSSYMPVVASGDESSAFPALDPAKYYYVSVIPKTSGSYSIGGAPFKGGAGSVAVTLNQLPLPTAQITIFVFNDNFPINNAPDLPEEQGLAGFSIILEDGGGRYGMSAGTQMMDAFGNPLGTTYNPDGSVAVMGTGVIVTDVNGEATIKNLAPGKYGIQAVPPGAVKDPLTGNWVSSDWTQTATIEGTKIIDAWVKANEPPFFQEFGPPGWHVFIGFVNAGPNTPYVDSTVLTGGSTVTGQVVNLHMSRPPDYAFYNGAPLEHTTAWVGLNQGAAGAGRGVFAKRANSDGTFSIPNVPPGDYQLVIWDDALDIIFAFHSITVDGGDLALGDIPVFQWFTRQEHYVFNDLNQNGFRDPGEPGIFNQAVNLRWRDGTMNQSAPTDTEGFVPFDEVFPFLAWQVAEVDFARFKATGVTVTVDAGGAINPDDPWSWGGQLNPQSQVGDTASAVATDTYRTETGPVLLEAYQGMLGQTSVFQWGKTNYGPGPDGNYSTGDDENGGITGVVYYSTTRAENDPRYGVAEPWEPGIPRVQVNLYKDANNDGVIDDTNASGGVELADVDNYPFDSPASPFPGPEDKDRNNNGSFDLGDAVEFTKTDSWDDNLPEGCKGDVFTFQGSAKDCYDGLRNFNQVRPGVFDGGYAFGSAAGNILNAGIYIVEAVPPPGYEIVKEEDKNVDFGEDLVPSPLALPPVCVGDMHPVPQYLTLFEDQQIEVAGWTPGMMRPYCDRKQVFLSDGQNAAADFFLFTKAPIAGHIYGFILDDTQNEFDPNAPNFGEKFAPPWLPISIRDWTGRELSRTLSDQYGVYNALVPSTYSANLPQPSGMSPSMITVCLNSPTFPNGTPDPLYNPQYSQYCYTFQYMPGTTTYLDTPVLPVAAFAGPGQYPLDSEFVNRTPKIKQVTGGPYVPSTGGTLNIVSEGTVLVPNPAYCPGPPIANECTEPYDQNKTIPRDYGFGSGGSVKLVAANGTTQYTLSTSGWSSAGISATVPASVPNGSYQLVITRSDSGKSSITGVTVQKGLRTGATLRRVDGPSPIGSYPGAIQQAIDAAYPNDLILVAPGQYEELVIMWKPLQLQGWGPGSVKINAVKAPAEKLLYWRNKVTDLITAGAVDLLPAQEVGGGNPEPITLFNEEGPGILVLSDSNSQSRFDLNSNRGARIDGFAITGADHGGGLIVNGYAHYLEISNNRIFTNNGVFGGGIRVGHPTLTLDTDQGLAYQSGFNDNIRIHNNHIMQNSSLSGAGGGVSLYTGTDAYKVTDNFISGNFATEGGGGIGHLGLSNGGQITRNTILFNESFQQGITVNGGGLLIAGGAPLNGPGSLSPGAGSVAINANLIQGNAAGAGDGGGIRTHRVNGQDVADNSRTPNRWYTVNIFNNMIVNNLAALAGGGISLQDSARVNIMHNTIANNDSTGTAGEAFAPGFPNESTAQPAGIVSRAHTPELAAAFAIVPATAQYRVHSNARLVDDIIWHNRSFFFSIDPNADPQVFGLEPRAVDPYWDLAVLGAPGALSTASSLRSGGADPAFVAEYLNGDRGQTINQPEFTTAIEAPPAFDEGGNFIRVRFGPLTQTLADGTLRGDYHIQPVSPARNAGANLVGSFPDLARDFDNQVRPFPANKPVDIGADELQLP